MTKRQFAFNLIALLASCCATYAAAEESPSAPNGTPPRIVRDVTYVRRGGKALKADIYVPPQEGPCPGVLMVHGGGWRAGHRSHMHLDAMQVVQHGYAVVSISYRLAPQHKYPAQLDDCRVALQWMRENAERYKIDPSRIAGYGYSAGGHLVSLLGASGEQPAELVEDGAERPPSTRLQAVVAGGAPCDFRWIGPQARALVYWLGKTRGEDPQLYRQASPLTFATKDDPPFFFYHGELDLLVPLRSPTGLHDRLTELGVSSELHLVKDSGHVVAFLNQEALPAAIEFLDRELKGQGTLKGQTDRRQQAD